MISYRAPLIAVVALLTLAPIAGAEVNSGDADPAKLPPPPAGCRARTKPRRESGRIPGFANPPPGYGAVAFYWWLGDPLTKATAHLAARSTKGSA